MKIFATIAAMAILAGGSWYLASGRSLSNASKDASEATLIEGKAVTGSPEELTADGGQYRCTFAMADMNSESSGTVYLEGRRFKGEFKSTVKAMNQTLESYNLSDGKYSYTWTANSPVGLKMPIISGTLSGVATGSMDFSAYGAKAAWKCAIAKFDETMFALPAGVSFVENAGVTR